MVAKKKITAAHIKSLYNAGLVRYHNSYAQMVDDAMAGVIAQDKKLGTKLGVYSDGGIFPLMYMYIRNHTRYENVPANVCARILQMAEREVARGRV